MKIGIIGAMEIEVAKLKADMKIKKIVEKASMEFVEGTLFGKDVVVVKCGVGKLAAGICTQILVDLFDVTHIINTGIAGSLDENVKIGDIVVSEDVIYHDVDVTIFGYEMGQQAGMPKREFKADEELVGIIKEAAEIIIDETDMGDVALHFGRICSGDQFVGSDTKKIWIKDTFDGLCTEMEGASIAHTCYLNHIPFVIVRAISDGADDDSEVNYPRFEKQVAEHCAKITERVVKAI